MRRRLRNRQKVTDPKFHIDIKCLKCGLSDKTEIAAQYDQIDEFDSMTWLSVMCTRCDKDTDAGRTLNSGEL